MSEVGRQIFSPENMGQKKPDKGDKAYQLMKEELNRTLEALNGTMANTSIAINWKEIFGTADAPNYVEVNDAHREVSYYLLFNKINDFSTRKIMKLYVNVLLIERLT